MPSFKRHYKARYAISAMNPLVPELAPLMLAAPESLSAANVAVFLGACGAGVLARLWGLKIHRAYAAVCVGAVMWVVSRDFGIPLDALLVAALPLFAMAPVSPLCELANGMTGVVHYIVWVFVAEQPLLPTIHVAWVGALVFLYVLGAADWTGSVVRAGFASLWFVFPRAAHLASGAMIVTSVGAVMDSISAQKPSVPIMVALGATLAVAVLGQFPAAAFVILGGLCVLISI